MTGIYHIMLKGIDGRNIFLDEEDDKRNVPLSFSPLTAKNKCIHIYVY